MADSHENQDRTQPRPDLSDNGSNIKKFFKWVAFILSVILIIGLFVYPGIARKKITGLFTDHSGETVAEDVITGSSGDDQSSQTVTDQPGEIVRLPGDEDNSEKSSSSKGADPGAESSDRLGILQEKADRWDALQKKENRKKARSKELAKEGKGSLLVIAPEGSKIQVLGIEKSYMKSIVDPDEKFGVSFPAGKRYMIRVYSKDRKMVALKSVCLKPGEIQEETFDECDFVSVKNKEVVKSSPKGDPPQSNQTGFVPCIPANPTTVVPQFAGKSVCVPMGSQRSVRPPASYDDGSSSELDPFLPNNLKKN